MARPVKVLQVEYPEEVLGSVGEDELASLAQEALLVRLYDLGKISSGLAAQSLGVSRRAFLDILGRYGVSSFDEEADLGAEARIG
jgi:predicted HTH domain antitoxin